MRTRFLQTFVRIGQIGSFSKVAEEMNTTLSTVSMQMKSLEEELGVELFDREFRPPLLTPQGRSIIAYATSMLEAEKQLKDACGISGQLTGTYRIGFVATASVRLLPGFLKNAKQYAPEAEFQLETALSESLEQKVRAGQLDAAVVTDTGDDLSGLSINSLREEEMKYAMPDSYGEKSLEDLFNSIPFLQFNPGSGIGRLIEKEIRRYRTEASRRMIVLDSVEAIMACVNNGLGFTLLAEPDILRYASQTTIVEKPEGDRFVRQLSLISSSHQTATKNAELLVQLFD